jgi:hypothetical protein
VVVAVVYAAFTMLRSAIQPPALPLAAPSEAKLY